MNQRKPQKLEILIRKLMTAWNHVKLQVMGHTQIGVPSLRNQLVCIYKKKWPKHIGKVVKAKAER